MKGRRRSPSTRESVAMVELETLNTAIRYGDGCYGTRRDVQFMILVYAFDVRDGRGALVVFFRGNSEGAADAFR